MFSHFRTSNGLKKISLIQGSRFGTEKWDIEVEVALKKSDILNEIKNVYTIRWKFTKKYPFCGIKQDPRAHSDMMVLEYLKNGLFEK
ncbi:hypothetical protein Glove_117g75 [Diversispora epigaea]|uniref:Uncharacterized protein n=1 Tax=Diversispora epigaea TaxID=1348612 RepID=A0A397J9H8_9GLOM|nr:hypothetical protein Glove_117g75 [Diversispora epigaea]